MREDRLLRALELGPRLQAELRDERPSRVRIYIERLGLPPRAIEREHELRTEALSQRLLANERLQLRDDLRMPPAREIRIDARTERVQPLLLESWNGREREPLVLEIGQRSASPQIEGGAVRPRRVLIAPGVEL